MTRYSRIQCAIPDCSGKFEATGYCTKHYQRLKKWGDPYRYAKVPRSDSEAIASIKSRIIEDGNGCWVWQGRLNQNGYGTMGFRAASWLVHRVTYEVLAGHIPEGLVLDHLCRNRACCNPDHLEPVTVAENNRRGAGVSKTHCKNGHPLFGENLRITSKGGRSCRICYIAGQISHGTSSLTTPWIQRALMEIEQDSSLHELRRQRVPTMREWLQRKSA